MTSIATRQSGLLTAALNLDDNRTSRLNNRATNTRIQQQDQYTNAKKVFDDLNGRIDGLLTATGEIIKGPYGREGVSDDYVKLLNGAATQAAQLAQQLGLPYEPRHKEIALQLQATPTGGETEVFNSENEALGQNAFNEKINPSLVGKVAGETKNAEIAATDHAALGQAEGEKALANKAVVFEGTAKILGLKEGTPEYEEFNQQFSGYSPKEYSFSAYTIAAVQEKVADKLEKGISLTPDEFSRFKSTAESLGGASFFGQFAKELKGLNTESGGYDPLTKINPQTGNLFTQEEMEATAEELGITTQQLTERMKKSIK